jgi:hypothetical protein
MTKTNFSRWFWTGFTDRDKLDNYVKVLADLEIPYELVGDGFPGWLLVHPTRLGDYTSKTVVRAAKAAYGRWVTHIKTQEKDNE